MYAVFGATGNTGRATVKELQALGEDPLCVVRNKDKAREVLGTNSRTVVAEISDRAAIERALTGIERVFVVTGHNPHAAEQQINILEAARSAKPPDEPRHAAPRVRSVPPGAGGCEVVSLFRCLKWFLSAAWASSA